MLWQLSRRTSAVILVCLASLSAVCCFVPLGAKAPAFAGVARRAACPLAAVPRVQAGRIVAGRRALGLHMVDIQPRVDIEAEDFVGTRPGSGGYTLDDGGTEMSAVEEEEFSSEEEREPGDVRNFPISEQTLDNLARRGITQLFPIQYETFNQIYDGRDVLARARTGTGKTMGFALPILERLIRDKTEKGTERRSRGTKPSCIILSPTRELAVQVEREIEGLTDGGNVKINTLCVYGGVSYSTQERELRNGIDMVVGTPGRMIDLYEKGALDLSEVRYLVSTLLGIRRSPFCSFVSSCVYV